MIKGRLITVVVVSLVALLMIVNRELLSYALGQAVGQLRIVFGARSIEAVLRDDDVDASVKSRIRLVQDIRTFAFDSLGIEASKNYTTYYDQKGRDLLWVVTACPPFALEAYTWEFPIIGSFGYKGFFDSLKAVREAESLIEQGLDVSIRPVGGWSTLGYFKDPILSKMLERGEAELAELIIHELTHGSIYVKDSTTFNENLATFIGIKGSERFLASKYGKRSPVIRAYRRRNADGARTVGHILRGANYLDSLYRTMGDNSSLQRRLLVKTEAIEHIVQNADSIVLNSGRSFAEYLEAKKPNNTYFMSYLRYRGYTDLLESEFRLQYGGDIRRMLQDYRRRFPSL